MRPRWLPARSRVGPSDVLEGVGDDVAFRVGAAIATSALGTWSYNVGIAVFAFQQTGSVAWVAVATVGRYIPALVIAWWGSRWVSRWPRRRVAVVSDLVCAVAMMSIALLAAANTSLVLAIALAALSSGTARVQNSATLALAADCIPESRLMGSMARIGSWEAVATALGPAVAAVLLTIADPWVLFVLNGVSFLASALLLTSIQTKDERAESIIAAVPGRPSPGRQPTLKIIRSLLAVRVLVAFIYGADVVLLAVVATEQLRQGTSGYGWLLAGAGLGGLASALVFQRRDATEPIALSAVSGFVIYAAPLLVFLLVPETLASVGVQALRGFGYVLVTTTVTVAIQRSVPSALSDQVFGATHALVLAGTATGSVAALVLLHLVGLDWTVAVLAIVPLLLVLPITPALRRFDRDSPALLATLDPQVSLLRGLSLFRHANRTTLIELAEGITETDAAQGDVIIVEGDASDALYILVSGSVQVTSTGDGQERVLRDMQAPAYFGEIGIVHGVRRTATVTASTDCSLWQIPAAQFVSAASRAGLSGSLSEGINVRLHTTAAPSVGASET